MIINISVAMADPYNAVPPNGLYTDILLANIPDGYGLERSGTPPPEWYLSISPLSFDGTYPNGTELPPTYIPSPPDPSKPNISPTFVYVGIGDLNIPGVTSLPGIVIPDTTLALPQTYMPQSPAFEDYQNILNTITTGLNNTLTEPQNTLNNITNTIVSGPMYTMDSLTGLTDRIGDRINNNIINTMSEVYSEAYPIGFAIPSTEQIITGEPVYSPYGIGPSMMPPPGSTGSPGSGPTFAESRFPTGINLPQGVGVPMGGGFGQSIAPSNIGVTQVNPPPGDFSGPQFIFPPVPFGMQPVPGDIEAPRVQNVGGVVGPPQAGRPIPGGAFAPVALAAPIFNPPNIGGGGGGIVGVPIGGGGGAGVITGYSGTMGESGYPPGSYPPGSYPPGSYPPGSYPPAGDYNYQGGDYNYQGGDTSYDGGTYAPISTSTSIDTSTSTSTTVGDTTTTTTTTTTNNYSPTPAPSPTDSEDSSDNCPSPSPTPTPTPDKPPPPAPLDIIEGSLSPNQTNWESGASCAAAPNPGGYNPASIWDAFGWSVVKPGEYKPPAYLDPNNWPTGTKSVGSTLMNLFGLFTQTSVKAASASIPIVNNWNDFLVLAMGGVVQNWVGAPILEFMKSTVYNINYNNPQSIPSEAECVNLFLAGEIDEQTMRCLVRANGSYDTWYSKIANSGRTKLSNDQIIQLRRRGILDDPTTNLLMRGNGVIDEQEQLWIYKATEAMPSVSDIVRFMVRDADDNTVADRYGTDAQLSTKYGAQLQSWAKGQGITDEVMKYYWRSHWEIPSNTALFEMLHRLRPNRTGQGLTGGITVNSTDIKDALVVNDVLPFWAERLMEISYKPLTRTDAQRAYFIDALSENELKDSYLDLGYAEDNADRLVRFTNQLKAKRKQTTGGTEKVPAVIKYYKNWLIGSTEATQRLRNSGLSETAAKEALQIASVQRKNDSQIKCIAGVKSQFKRYIIDDIEARRDLTDIGVALENVGPLVNNWRCERASKPKELSATQVCQAYQNNLINDVEYRRRLGAIGYQEDESGILLEICRTKKGNLNDGSGDTTRIRTQQEKNDQTAAARAITAAAMSALNPPLEP